MPEPWSAAVPPGPDMDRVPTRAEISTSLVASGIESNPGWGEGNRYAVLASLGGASAEEALARMDEGHPDAADPWDDDTTHEIASIYLGPALAAHQEFDKNPHQRTAKLWIDRHVAIDSADSDGKLSKGARRATKFQPSDDKKKGKKGENKTRSPAMQARDAARLHSWLSGQNKDVAEAWVRANKPPEAAVPKTSRYMEAYANGAKRSTYYGDLWREDRYIGNVLGWADDVEREEATYLGPMTRGLIQTLLAIGNVEKNPGPSTNGEMVELWRYQNVAALCHVLDHIEAQPAWPIRVVILGDLKGFLGAYFSPLFVVELDYSGYVAVPGDVTILLANCVEGMVDVTNSDYVICRDVRRQSGEQTVAIPGLVRTQYRYERNLEMVSYAASHFHCHDDIFLHQGNYSKLTVLLRTNGVAYVHNQPCVSVFKTLQWQSAEPRSRHRTVVSAGVYYDVTPECIAVIVDGEYCSFDRELWNQILAAVSGASFEDSLRAFMARLKSSKTIDMNVCGHLSAAASHAGATNTRSIVSHFTRQRDSYHAAIADLQWGFWKFFRTNVYDYNVGRRYLWGDERVSVVHVAVFCLAGYGVYKGVREMLGGLGGYIGAWPTSGASDYMTQKGLDIRRTIGHAYDAFIKSSPRCLDREMVTGKAGPTTASVVASLNSGDSSVLKGGVPEAGLACMAARVGAFGWSIWDGSVRIFRGSYGGGGGSGTTALALPSPSALTLSFLSFPFYKMVAPSFEEALVEAGLPFHYAEVIGQPWKVVPFLVLRHIREPDIVHALFNFCVEPTPYTLLPCTLMAGKRIMAMGAYAQFRGVPAKPGWKIKEPTSLLKTRNIQARTLLPSPYNMSAMADNPGNVEKAFVERHAMVVPGDDAIGRANKRRLWADVALQVGHVEPVDIMEVVADFEGGKRDLYYRAACEYMHLGLGEIARAARLESHIKAELAVAAPDRDDGQAEATPRAIQAHTVVQLLLQGAFMIPFTKRCIDIWGIGKDGRILGVRVVFAYGCTRTEVSDEINRLQALGEDFILDCGDDAFLYTKDANGNWLFITTDSSRHDAHVTKTDLSLKVETYRDCGCPEETYILWKDSLKRRGSFYKGQMPYVGDETTVNSGSRCTTNGNGFHTAGGLMEFIELRNVQLVMARCGLKLKVASCSPDMDDINHEFCSGIFVPTADGVAFSVKPGRAAARASHTVTLGVDSELLQSKIDSLYLNLWAFPELQDVLRPLKKADLSYSYTQPGFKEPASAAVRAEWFFKRYGQHYSEFVAEFSMLFSKKLIHYHVIREVCAVDFGSVVAPEYDGLPEECAGPVGELIGAKRIMSARRRPTALSFEFSMPPLMSIGYGYRWLVDKILMNRRKRAYNGNGLLCRILLWILLSGLMLEILVGTTCGGLAGHENKFPEQLLSYQQQKRKTIMPNSKNQRKSAKAPLKIPQQQPPKKSKPKKQNVSASSVKGAGLYTLVGPMVKMAIKSALPSAFANASRLLRPNASNISGHGDYVTNDIVHAGASMPMKKGNSGVPPTVYTHSEYVGDLLVPAVGATGFVSKRYSINPTDTATFPWLSRLSALFTKYKFTKLLFEFRSTSSNFSATGPLGGVIMAPHYNVDSLAFTTKQQMEASTHAVSAAPCNSVLMGFECSKSDSNVKWYNLLNDTTIVRNNFTDAGYVEIATNGLPGAVGGQVGEIWVHYTCELIEPYISVGSVASAINGLAGGIYSTATGTTAELGANFLGLTTAGTGQLVYSASNFGTGGKSLAVNSTSGSYWVSVNPLGNQISFQSAGTYILDLQTKYSSTPTASTGNPYDLSVVSGAGTVTTGNSSAVWSSTVYGSAMSYRWVVSTSQPNTVINSAKGSGWNFGTANGYGSNLYVTQIA
jgi:hypothetical protein